MDKYLHTVASVGCFFTLNYDALNHELKKKRISLYTVVLTEFTWCTLQEA